MAGIYIHIPFCKQKCTYCDFHFSTTFEEYRERMIDAMVRELEQRKLYLAGEKIETIYFGGGTPSLLTISELNRLLTAIKFNFEIDKAPEITLEANPDDMTNENLADWKEIGINRLSIGLQSFRQEDLAWMNRAHNEEEARRCVDKAKKHGFENISVDLIYGLPNLSMDQWESHIQEVIDMEVQHISAYCLTVEKKTALHHLVASGKLMVSNEDEQSDQFLKLIEQLQKAGFEQYEISNFAKPTFQSKHNSNYWKAKKYLGIGPSAHSFNHFSRAWNIANNRAYMKGVEEEINVLEIEELTHNDRFNEMLLTGLRTIYGVDINSLSQLVELDAGFNQKVDDFQGQGWLELKNDRLYLTSEGRLKADYIAAELFVN